MPVPLDDLFQSDAQRAADAIRQRNALGVDPAADGALVDASARLRTPVEVLREAPKVELNDLLTRDTRDRVLARNPTLAKAVANSRVLPSFVGDDMTALENLSKAADAWSRIYRDEPTTGKKWAATMTEAAAGYLSGLGQAGSIGFGLAAAGLDAVGAEEAARTMRGKGLFLLDLPAQLVGRVRGEDPNVFREDLDYSKQLSLLQTNITGQRLGIGDLTQGATSYIPVILAALASGGSFPVMMAAGGLQSGAPAYLELSDAGDEEAASKALLSGLITAATMRFIGPNADKALAAMFRAAANPKAALRNVLAPAIGKVAFSEGLEEFSDQLLQEFLVNGRTFSESVSSAVNAGLIGSVLGGAVGAIGARAHQQMKVEAAKNQHAVDVSLATAADLTQLSGRTKEGLKEFLQSHPGVGNSERIFAHEDIAPLLADPEVEAALAPLGITREKLAAGDDVKIKMADLLALDAPVRDKLLPHARNSADAYSKAEADQIEPPKPAEKRTEAEKDSAKEIQKAIRKEEKRLVKELEAAGLDADSAKTSLELLFRGARGLYALEPALARRPLDLLARVKFRKGETDPKEKLAAINAELDKMAGITGKPGMEQVQDVELATNLGAAAARLDVLTGRIELNPAAVPDAQAAAEVVGKAKAARAAGPSLAGKTVKVYSPSLEAEIEAPAEGAVAELRNRLESARKFVDCLRS
jgi:hypothetical protein